MMESVGKRMFGVELRLVGDDGEGVLPGEVGEIRGPTVMAGYHHQRWVETPLAVLVAARERRSSRPG